MKELWKDISGYEGVYQISNLGRVKRLAYISEISPRGYKQYMHFSEKILKPYTDKSGYVYTHLSKAGKTNAYLLHRLVAETFIPNPDNLPVVNHKDENKSNNCVDNLEWCTQQYNASYGNGAISRRNTIRKLQGKEIEQYDLFGNLVDTLKTAHDKEPEFSTTKIIACCRGNRKTHKKYIWKYKEG